jgi:feruloyl-CoA synthase
MDKKQLILRKTEESDIFIPQSISKKREKDGGILHESDVALKNSVNTTGEWLKKWSKETPNNIFIAQRSGAGWRSHSYLDTYHRVQSLAAGLLSLGLDSSTPLLFLSGKSIDHGLLMLAAQYVGIPTVAIAEQYSLTGGTYDKLRHAINLTKPRLIFVDDFNRFENALEIEELSTINVIYCDGKPTSPRAISISQLQNSSFSTDIDEAHSKVTPDSLAKLMFTSGSTSLPKAVCTTHKMLCVNQTQIAQVWPFLKSRPPKIVDWLPWSHTFGGSHNFNLMLANGGTLYIDDGSPTQKGIARTIENIRLAGQTVSFNVPLAFSMMENAMRSDDVFRHAFFSDLDLVFYAAASMPQNIWDQLQQQAIKERGFPPAMSASWGMTETAPAAIMVHAPITKAGVIGAPLPGVTAKLIPLDSQRYELRIKGPNVTKGYFMDEKKTLDAFDSQGYLITGDAVHFVDPDIISKGLCFDSRISEDFKLLSGTWVHVSRVRNHALDTLSSLIKDLVITGHGKSEIGALVFPNTDALAERGISIDDSVDVMKNPELLSELKNLLQSLAEKSTGSSTKIARAIILSSPPSFIAGEITQKGYLNQNKILTLRADIVSRLYDDENDEIVRV